MKINGGNASIIIYDHNYDQEYHSNRKLEKTAFNKMQNHSNHFQGQLYKKKY